MKPISHSMVAAAIVSLGLAQHAWADPIVITGGSMLVTGPSELGSISLRGTRGFSLEAGVGPTEGAVDAINRCGFVEDFCVPGTTLSIGTNLSYGAFPNGVATLDGVTYSDFSSNPDAASPALRLTGSFTLPPLQAAPITILAPFSIGPRSVFIRPFPDEWVPIRGPGGTATLRLVPGPGVAGVPPPWVVDQIQYDFAPIPEPATVALVGTGLVGAWRYRRSPHRDLTPNQPSGEAA